MTAIIILATRAQPKARLYVEQSIDVYGIISNLTDMF